jgi:hypothetical protein
MVTYSVKQSNLYTLAEGPPEIWAIKKPNDEVDGLGMEGERAR